MIPWVSSSLSQLMLKSSFNDDLMLPQELSKACREGEGELKILPSVNLWQCYAALESDQLSAQQIHIFCASKVKVPVVSLDPLLLPTTNRLSFKTSSTPNLTVSWKSIIYLKPGKQYLQQVDCLPLHLSSGPGVATVVLFLPLKLQLLNKISCICQLGM